MTSKKNTRRALFTSIMSLILCFAMLMGTTFAWFTDSVTSGNNIIKSGNLDVEMYYADGTQAVPAKDSTDWKDASKGAIFNYDLWEPGYTDVRHIKIKNAGTLALKYQLMIQANGTVSDLTDVIDVYFVDPAQQIEYRTNLNDADKVGTLSSILARMPANTFGTLEAGKETVVTLALKMQETAGNEYKGLSIGSDFAVILHATQLTSEKDFFGPDYDLGADVNDYTDVIVTNEEELKAALAEAKNGAVIGIKGEVTWTTGAEIDSTPFIDNSVSTIDENEAKPAIVNNITLVGVDSGATFTADGEGVGAIGIDGGMVTFKNLTIADNSKSYAEGSWEYGYLEFRGNTAFKNCKFVNAIMMEGDSASFNNCSFNSGKDSEYDVWVSNGTASFENCTFTGYRGIKVHEAYGSEVASVVINNNRFIDLAKKPGLAIGNVNADTKIAVTNNEFIGTQAGDQGLYSYETDTDVTTFNFTYSGNNIVNAANTPDMPDGLYKADDDTYYATTTSGLNAGIERAEAGDTIILSSDVTYTGNGYAEINKDITLDLNGNNIDTTSYGVIAKAGTIKNGTITNPVGVRAALRTWTGVSIEDVTIVSPKNGGITVASGNSLPYIKNVTIEAETYGIELQNYASVDTIENVTIKAGSYGIIAQAATVGKIKNCTINGDNAGVWAQLKGTNDLNLTFTNSTVKGGNYGLYMCDEGATIVPDGVAKLAYDESSTFSGRVKDMEFAFGQTDKLIINGNKIGAVISTADDLFAFAKAVNQDGNNFSGMTVLLVADIDLNNAAWTPIGQTGATEFKGTFDGQNYTIKNLNVNSVAETGKHYSSGLFGWAESAATIQNVKIDGAKVVGNHNVAVLVGYTYSNKISNCHITNASVTCKHANDDACGDKCGLIVGYAGDESRINNCSASNSTVTAGRDAGQLIGCGYNTSLTNCYATNVTVNNGGGCTGANINNAVIGRSDP